MGYWGYLVVSLLFRRRRKMKKKILYPKETPIQKMTLRSIDPLELSSRGFVRSDIDPSMWNKLHHHICGKGFLPKASLRGSYDGWWHRALQYYGENDDYASSLKIFQERSTGEIILSKLDLKQTVATEEDAFRIFLEKVDEMIS